MEDNVSRENQILKSFPSRTFRMISKEQHLDLFVEFVGVESHDEGNVLVVSPNPDRDFRVVLTSTPFTELEDGSLYVYAKGDQWRLRRVSDEDAKKFAVLMGGS